jgi:hypothetical protein
MINFTSEKLRDGSEETRWLSLSISPSIDPNKSDADWYYIIDTKKSWKSNDNWIRVIKRNMVRINYAKKSQMTPYDREVEKYINDTFPLPQ